MERKETKEGRGMSKWPKPNDCARCGKPVLREKDTYWSQWRVRCPKCNSSTDWYLKAVDATTAWNVRNENQKGHNQ